MTACSSRAFSGALQPNVLDDSAPLVGITNLFFEPTTGRTPSGQPLVVGEGWIEIEVADLVGRSGPAPIWVVRYTSPGSGWRYRIDSDGDGNVDREQDLNFRSVRQVAIGDVLLETAALLRALGLDDGAIRSHDGQAVAYQIVTSNGDGYVFGRVAEYRTGFAELDGQRLSVLLRPRSRNDPFYAIASRPRFYLDLDRDGRIDQVASVTRGGARVAAEETDITQPFFFGKRAYRVTNVDPGGTRLRIERSDDIVAVAPGFHAPPLAAITLDGESVTLASLAGRIVVLEFWSTSCRFCEEARPTLNALAAEWQGQPVTWMAMAPEVETTQIAAFLTEHPVDALVTIATEDAWDTYNREVETPTFYVIDGSGVIRLRARGAAAVADVASTVADLLSSARR